MSTTGWGSSTLPPGMEPSSAEAAAYLKAISAQQGHRKRMGCKGAKLLLLPMISILIVTGLPFSDIKQV
eukprot:scaffold647825_cov40-Prasinocladus_malaysianus.AAC.1